MTKFIIIFIIITNTHDKMDNHNKGTQQYYYFESTSAAE